MSTHSPAPWAIDSLLPPNARSVIARTTAGTPISASTIGPHDTNDDHGNAQLIAAAPELLAALQLFANLDRITPNYLWAINREYCKQARAAIAKATT